MQRFKPLFITAFILLHAAAAIAQWDAPLSQYWAAKTYYNPAFAGETAKGRASAFYRYEWSGIENAPKKIIVTADMPLSFLNRKHGVGMVSATENLGDLRNAMLAVQYAYTHKTSAGEWNIGVRAGVYDLKYDAGSIRLLADTIAGNGKPALEANTAAEKIFDLHAGISYTGRRFFAGLSVMHLNRPAFYASPDSLSSAGVTGDSARAVIPRTFNLMAGYNIILPNPLYELQPMVWVLAGLDETQVQATLRAVYKKKLSAGASWRSRNGYAFFAGAVIKDIEMGYAYEWHTAGIGRESQGSHEIGIRYRFDVNAKEQRPAQKSIRIL